MLAGESGFKVISQEGEDYYVFYRPFTHTGWSVAIVCPESDIFEPYNRLKKTLLTITIVGICLLLFFCVFIIRYNLRPLKQLGISAEKMAEGDFHVAINDSKRRDEIGQLQHSFSRMQRSLNEYISKIQDSTKTLTEQNEELIKAHELSKEDDRMKTAVINNMTDKMAHPVDLIADESDISRRDYKNLSEEEMTRHVDLMLENTEIVTSLLNQILEASDASGVSSSTGASDTTTLSNEETAAP